MLCSSIKCSSSHFGSKTHFFTKKNYHSNSGPGFSIFARSLLLPTPNERRDQMCQVSLPAPQQRQGQMCRNGGEPRDRPGPQAKTHFLRKKIITQHLAVIFQFLPAPSSSLHPLNGETRCARFLGSPKPAQPENLAHLLLPSLHHSKRQGQMCRNGENPEIGPQSKKHFLRKEFITQHLALIFQFLPAPSSSLHPMNGETKCARFLGSPGPAEPENLAHLLLPSLHHSKRQGQMCRNGENPEIGPQSKTHFLRKEIITQNLALVFQFLPAPSSSLHPMNGETKCARFPSQHHSNGKAKCAGMGGNPEIGPDPKQKRTFYEKKLSLNIWPLFFNFCPLPSSSLHPLNGETRCARFLGSPKPAQPENLAHLLLPSLHHSKRQGQMCRNGENPEIGPQSKKHFLRKEFITQHLALIFQFLPAPSSSLHPMNGETKCARFLGSPGPAEPENLAHLLLPSLHHSNGKAKCAGMSNQKRNFYEKNLSLKIWP